jgi:hypothetical protein
MSVRFHDLTDRAAARIQSRLAAEDGDAGMVASEYVMATAVGAGCVGVVYKVVTNPSFLSLVTAFIKKRFGLIP